MNWNGAIYRLSVATEQLGMVIISSLLVSVLVAIGWLSATQLRELLDLEDSHPEVFLDHFKSNLKTIPAELALPFLPTLFQKGHTKLALDILSQPHILSEFVQKDKWYGVRNRVFDLFDRPIARALVKAREAAAAGSLSPDLLPAQISAYLGDLNSDAKALRPFREALDMVIANLCSECQVSLAQTCRCLWDSLKTSIRQSHRIKLERFIWRTDIKKVYGLYLEAQDVYTKAHLEARLVQCPDMKRFSPVLMHGDAVESVDWAHLLRMKDDSLIKDGYNVLRQLAAERISDKVVQLVLQRCLDCPGMLPKVCRSDIELLLEATATGYSSSTIILFAKHIDMTTISLREIVNGARAGLSSAVLELLLCQGDQVIKSKHGHALFPFLVKTASGLQVLLQRLSARSFIFSREEFLACLAVPVPGNLLEQLVTEFQIKEVYASDISLLMLMGASEPTIRALLLAVLDRQTDPLTPSVWAACRSKYSKELIRAIKDSVVSDS